MEKSRRKFSREFKIEAVRKALTSGAPTSHTARSLDVRPEVLYNWIRAFRDDTHLEIPSEAMSLDEEVRRLRRELARVTEERDILKKAAQYFAKESP